MAISQLKITAAFKKKVKQNWQEQIPSLIFDPKIFFVSRLVGPLNIRVSFDTKTFNNDYYPVFNVQNLSTIKDYLCQTMRSSLMNSRINAAGEKITSVVSISMNRHEKGDYIEAANLMKEQARLPLEGGVSISIIWDAYQRYCIEEPGYFSVSLLEDPALIAAWAGREDIARKSLDWGYETYKAWCATLQKPDPKHNPDAWLAMMKKRIADPETLRRNVVEMIKKHKLEYLPQEELIPE